MFIITVNYIKPLEDVEEHLQAHSAFLDRYYASGTLICSGRQVPRTGGIILSRASSKEEVEAMIVEDPFHKHSIATYNIIEFIPTKCAEAFQPVME